MSRLRTLRPLAAVEPKFVDNRQIRTRVVAQMCGKRFVGEGSGQVGESLGGSAIQNAVALDADLLSQRLDDVTLSDSTPADQDQVIAAPDEIAAGQFFDLHAVEGFGVELPVEPFQGLAVRKTGFPNAPRDGAFPARVGLCPQQQIEKVQRERDSLSPPWTATRPAMHLPAESPESRSDSNTGHAEGSSSSSVSSWIAVSSNSGRYVPDSRHCRPDGAVAASELLGDQESSGHFAPDRLL